MHEDGKPVIENVVWRGNWVRYQRRVPKELQRHFEGDEVIKFALKFTVADWLGRDHQRCEKILADANSRVLGWFGQARDGTLVWPPVPENPWARNSANTSTSMWQRRRSGGPRSNSNNSARLSVGGTRSRASLSNPMN